MHELRKISRDGPNDSIEGEYKTNNKHVIVTPKFYLCQENIVVLIVVKTTKVLPVFFQNKF